MLEFVVAHKVEILGALLAISEVLGLVPSIKSNGIFDTIVKFLGSLKGPSQLK